MNQAMFEEMLIFVGVITAMGCFTGIVLTLIKRWRSKPAELGREVSAGLTDIAERLARIEHSSDAMSLEIERISEGQRFTTKLLAERAQSAGPLEQSRRVVTPH